MKKILFIILTSMVLTNAFTIDGYKFKGQPIEIENCKHIRTLNDSEHGAIEFRCKSKGHKDTLYITTVNYKLDGVLVRTKIGNYYVYYSVGTNIGDNGKWNTYPTEKYELYNDKYGVAEEHEEGRIPTIKSADGKCITAGTKLAKQLYDLLTEE